MGVFFITSCIKLVTSEICLTTLISFKNHWFTCVRKISLNWGEEIFMQVSTSDRDLELYHKCLSQVINTIIIYTSKQRLLYLLLEKE